MDIAGDHQAQVRVERQDLDEMLGNLVENAAKYGGGRVFVTVEPKGRKVDILVEDDGPGIPDERRGELFTRGARLDTTGKPGTGLGLAIVRDVAEIYGGCDPPRGKRRSGRPTRPSEPPRGLGIARPFVEKSVAPADAKDRVALNDSGWGISYAFPSLDDCRPARVGRSRDRFRR